MTTADPIAGPWMRDRLRRVGITRRSPLSDTLDAITAAMIELPYETLTKLRDNIEIAKMRAGGDRSGWGSLPHQQAQMAAAMGMMT